jgi:hypothetical protein
MRHHMISFWQHTGFLLFAVAVLLLYTLRCPAQYGYGTRSVWNPATGQYEQVPYNYYTGAPLGYGYVNGAYGAYGYGRSAYGAYGYRTGYNPYTGRDGGAAAGYNPYTGSRGEVAGSYNPYTGGSLYGARGYNALTGTAYRGLAGYNPYTGNRYAAGSSYNRWGHSSFEGSYNPMTGSGSYVRESTPTWRSRIRR